MQLVQMTRNSNFSGKLLNGWTTGSLSSKRFTLSKQISNNFVATLHCTASLLEGFLSEEYGYVLTARLIF